MNITALQDVDMENPDSLQEFMDLNALAHETIYGALMDTFQVVTEHYPMWLTAGITKDWLLLHDRVHKSIASALNLSIPVDLDSLDVKNKAQARDWQQNHLFAHQQIEQALNL